MPPVADPAAPVVDLSARDEGTGPPVLLVHGVGGDHTLWNAMVPTLAREFRVLAPDLRGHGRSPGPPGSAFSTEEMLDDLTRFLDAREIASAHWVGLSGGALVALRGAIERPSRFRSLTMVSGAAYTDAHTVAITDRWAETYAKEGPDRFALRLLKDVYYPDWIEEHLDYADQLRADVPHHDYRPATRWAKSLAKFDERNRIAGVRLPTLIVQAMDDQVVDASHGRILRQTIPGAQIKIFPQTGHLVPVERPDELAAAVSEFVRAAESRSAD